MCGHIQKGHKCILSGENFECQECGKNFTRKQNLNEHMRKTHKFQIKTLQTILCPLCNESFQTVVILDKHLVNNHNVILKESNEEFDCIEGNFLKF